jgi:two-component system sensor histidine kinase DegS
VSNRDITRRKLAEKELMERIKRETVLTQTIHTMQLDMARDLHDTIGQNISYLRMRLDHICENNLQTQLDLEKEFANLLKVADESYDLIRGTMDMLHTGGLENLTKSFTKYVAQVEERSSFKIDMTSQGQTRLLTQHQVRQIFFVFREAMSNIEKYANASKVSVKLDWAEDNFALMISDDGSGFHPIELPTGSHYGIKFMKERIESLDGVFSVQSTEGKGTTIKISIPYEQIEAMSFLAKPGYFK